MRINLLANYCYPGGIPVHQGEIAEILHRDYGAEVNLCVPWPLRYDLAPHRRAIAALAELSALYAPLRFLRKIRSRAQLEAVLSEADINHFHGTFSIHRPFLQQAISLSPRHKNAFTFHALPNGDAPPDRAALSAVLDRIARVFVVSVPVAEALHGLFPEIPAVVTPNAPFPCEGDLSAGPPVILFAGRLTEPKGIRSLLYMLEGLRLGSGRVRVIGLPDGNPEYSGQILAHGPDRVELLPSPVPRSQMQELFRRADIFFCPSHSEGGPLVVIEAMHAGCAVVTTPVGMVPQLIRDGENGFICESSDLEGQRRVLQQLLDSRDLRERIKVAARETLLPTWEATAGTLYRHYCEVLQPC